MLARNPVRHGICTVAPVGNLVPHRVSASMRFEGKPRTGRFCNGNHKIRPDRCIFVLFLVLLCSSTGSAQSLHERIDQQIAAKHSGPFAARTSDAEFLRRVSIDLIGMGPSLAETRAFLDDSSPHKRQSVIDRLLASPQFARRMQQVFDAMLMERRPEVSVSTAEWQEYLRRSFAEHKPLNRLFAEILSADGADAALRPAAKFYLDRRGDVNLLTRDVGRLFFGMDLQCCQCHDHPLVNSYLQSDYYGLSAFFHRGVLFTDKTSKQVTFGEKADGEVNYKSVFVKDDPLHAMGPHLPGQTVITEPQFEGATAYVVAPADGVRPAPRFSRRAALAREATSGQNADFNRNLANRLWAIMLGRGIVHPVDFRHEDNPPSHPELLDALSAELVASGYNLRAILREIALSETYQRSSEAPDGVDPASIPPQSFAIAELKPLSPEQLAWCMVRGLGYVDMYLESYAAQQQTDPRLAEVFACDERRQALQAEMAERYTHGILQGYGQQFAPLFTGAAGPGSETAQSTVHQALFIANGSLVRGMVAIGTLLPGKLAAMTNSHDVADDLYLGILARPSSREEELEVAEYLANRSSDRLVAIHELVWALLASGEFRFNH